MINLATLVLLTGLLYTVRDWNEIPLNARNNPSFKKSPKYLDQHYKIPKYVNDGPRLDATLLPELRGLVAEENVKVTTSPEYMCYRMFGICGSQSTIQLELPIPNENGYTFSTDIVDHICRIGAEYITCLERNLSPLELCQKQNIMVQQMRETYNFGCISNKTDMYNLVPCANKKLVQLKFFACVSGYTGATSLLHRIETDGSNIMLPRKLKKSLYCGLMADYKDCVFSTVLSSCEQQNAATVKKILDIGIRQTRIGPIESLDFTECPQYNEGNEFQ